MRDQPLADVLADHGLPADLLANPLIDRRRFLAALGGGIAVLLTWRPLAAQNDPEDRIEISLAGGEPEQIWGWLHIAEDGAITVYVGKVELGQNARTSLMQVAAEELGVEATDIRLVMADTSLTPFDMGTFGSRTTPYTVPPLRRAAAAARELLLDLAADQMGKPRGELTVRGGKVVHAPTGASAGFGELTEGKALLHPIPDDVPVVSSEEWRVVGRSVPKVDAEAIVTGRQVYARDVKRPGMLYGRVLRPPAQRARLTAVDSADAEALPDITVHRDGDFVGVVAPTAHEAERALGKVRAEWERVPRISQDELFEQLRRSARNPAPGAENEGSLEDGLAAADVTLEESYTVAYVAHAAIEPRSAVAEWEEDTLTVWASAQVPFGVRRDLSQVFDIPESRIRVFAPDLGSGFGGKIACQPAVEAARLAREVGAPVRVDWSRFEEMAWNYYRPAGVIDIRSGATRDGKLTAWEHRNYNSGPAGLATEYDVANRVIAHHPSESPLPQGAYRCLAEPANMFARETHMDELAAALEMDPLEFRLMNLSDTRLRDVVKAGVERFGWAPGPSGAGHGVGIACDYDKGGYLCTLAEVEVGARDRQVHVLRIVTAYDCGAVINPLQLENQIEGCATMALGPALFEAIKFRDGVITNPTLADYRLPRFSDTPAIEAVLVDRRDIQSAGAGETPFAGIAPAIGNAIFHATGVRLRSLPLAPEGVPA